MNYLEKTKTLLVMQWTAVFLFIVCLNVNVMGFTQDKVSLNIKNESLEDVLQKIIEHTSYQYFFQAQEDKDLKVSIHVKDVSVEEALSICFKNLPLSYQLVNKVIIVNSKLSRSADTQTDPGKTVTAQGYVMDESGKPLSGASVMVKESGITTLTNKQGEFQLDEVPIKSTLIFSFVGYSSQRYRVAENLFPMKIQLLITNNQLDETVVKGYYSTTKRFNTGDLTTIKSEDIQRQPVSNPLSALEGRVAGLVITRYSGMPGSGFQVLLRGQNSISSGNEPLYVIDGVPFLSSQNTFSDVAIGGGGIPLSPLNSINTADIDNIVVLKDADATAIYGSRGANGVVLITTKKGKSGLMKVDANFYTGFSKAPRRIHWLNTPDYLKMRHEAFYNDSVADPAGYIAPNTSNAPDLLLWDTTRNTNWQKLLTGRAAPMSDAELTISGGSAATRFLIGGAYRQEGTVFPGDFLERRTSFHTNFNHASADAKFKANLTILYSDDNNLLPISDPSTNVNLPPDAPPVYDSIGKLNWQNSSWTNPISYTLQKSKTVTDNLNGNLVLGYLILPGLEIKTSLGYNSIQVSNLQTTPLSSYDPAYAYLQSTSRFGNSNLKSWIVEPQADYHKIIGNGQLSALIGGSFSKQNSSEVVQTGTGFASDELMGNIGAASSVKVNAVGSSEYRYESVYGRLNYNWMEKYLLNLTMRRDGSSRFGPGKQFGNFGAVGVGWIFSKERFLEKNLSVLSFGKIRTSYGTTGNDQIGDYNYLNIYAPFPYVYQGGIPLYPIRLANTDYAWEVNKKFELGLDLGFFHDRLLISSNYYRNRSSNQLLQYNLASITGFQGVIANLPATVQNTGFEFTANANAIKTNNFTWSISANLTIPKNKLLSYPGLSTSSNANYYVVGQALSVAKLLHYTGIDQKTGTYTFYDYDKDGMVSFPNDYQKLLFGGMQFYGGLQNNFKYKGWELDFLFQFVRQKYGRNFFGTFLNMPGTMYNQADFVLNHWQNPGDKTLTQKFSNADGVASTAFSNMLGSDQIYSDASFIRLKNVAVSYELSETLRKKMHLQFARIYVQCQNLFTITNYFGTDPETKTSNLPPLQVITAGVQLTF